MTQDQNSLIPTEEEIAKLPRWAKIAFAARSARRVQPLFRHGWPEALKQYLNDIDTAISLVESLAAEPSNGDTVTARLVDASAAAGSAARAAGANSALSESENAADSAADSARAAVVYGLEIATKDQGTYHAALSIVDPVAAVSASVASAFAASPFTASVSTASAIRRDYELLVAMTERHIWGDQTPVPTEVFGPMWPDGVPEGWPDEEIGHLVEPSKKLVLQVAVPHDSDDDEVDEAVIKLAEEASRLHIAQGGTGLVIKAVHVFDEAMVPSEVRP